jgi:predicted flap endonuclease-1-like 5' DNA nuclease
MPALRIPAALDPWAAGSWEPDSFGEWRACHAGPLEIWRAENIARILSILLVRTENALRERDDMFKEYKGLMKSLRDLQDQLWTQTMADFPGMPSSNDVNQWQQKTFEGMNDLVGQAIRHALELQREWLGQWSERAGDKKLKPKTFSALSAEARDSTQRWVDNQYRLWDQWVQVLKTSGGPNDPFNLEAWEKAVQQSIQQQRALLGDWSEMTNFDKLSSKEAEKLSDQIIKAMEESIEAQTRLWSHWFGEIAAPEPPEAKPAPPRREKGEKKAGAKRKTRGEPAKGSDDLKRILGIGPGLEKKLKNSGISTLKQIAELTDDDIARLEQEIIKFSGRIKRDQWVEQAQKLIS